MKRWRTARWDKWDKAALHTVASRSSGMGDPAVVRRARERLSAIPQFFERIEQRAAARQRASEKEARLSQRSSGQVGRPSQQSEACAMASPSKSAGGSRRDEAEKEAWMRSHQFVERTAAEGGTGPAPSSTAAHLIV